MSNDEELRKIVREKYGEIAKEHDTEVSASCCTTTSSSCCSTDKEITDFSEDYTKLQGYNPDADLGLGCGLPTEFAKIKEGDTVV
jgi:arsenite methyltransferase